MEQNSAIENEHQEEVVSENPTGENTTHEAVNRTADDEKTDLLKAQAEIEAAKDKYIRLYSEFENFRRRTAKEKLDMSLLANEQVIKALLPVIDDFERAEKAIQNKNQDIEGYILINNKFKKVLEQFGVKPMELGPGSDFNVDLHEAITQIPSPDEKMKGKIVDVVEKGYLLNDKVVRFAKVVIGS